MNTNFIHTADDKMKRVIGVVDSIAGSKASVLIQGESGTGKELLSRYIHAKSLRSSKPFYAMNCAALPENLLESELFGYEKGAFTGADRLKLGKFEQASGSTFLLDEISEMPLVLQAKLLRVLQEGEVQRLGGGRPINVDVRVIATTNRDISEMVRSGAFRQDLYYRLNVIPVFIPPLRSRPQDIVLLTRAFVETLCVEYQMPLKEVTAEGWKKLKLWDWPGNVRELQNVVERSVLLAGSKNLEPKDILIKDFENGQNEDGFRAGMTVAEVERKLIEKTLEYTNQNRTHAADMLGISIRTLRNKLKEYRTESSKMNSSKVEERVGEAS